MVEQEIYDTVLWYLCSGEWSITWHQESNISLEQTRRNHVYKHDKGEVICSFHLLDSHNDVIVYWRTGKHWWDDEWESHDKSRETKFHVSIHGYVVFAANSWNNWCLMLLRLISLNMHSWWVNYHLISMLLAWLQESFKFAGI